MWISPQSINCGGSRPARRFWTVPSPGSSWPPPWGHRGPRHGDEMSAVHSIERDGSRLVLARYLEPLAPYLADDTLTEIVVNRPGEIFVEGPDGWTQHEAPALTHGY